MKETREGKEATYAATHTWSLEGTTGSAFHVRRFRDFKRCKHAFYIFFFKSRSFTQIAVHRCTKRTGSVFGECPVLNVPRLCQSD